MRPAERQSLHMAAMEQLSRYYINRMAANLVHQQPLTEAVASAIVDAPIAECDEQAHFTGAKYSDEPASCLPPSSVGKGLCVYICARFRRALI